MTRCEAWTVTSSDYSDGIGWWCAKPAYSTSQATVVAAAACVPPCRGGPRRVRLRRQAGRGDQGHQDLPLSRMRPRDQAEHGARGGLAGRSRGDRGRGPTALAYAVLGEPSQPGPDQEVVLVRQCEPAAGSTSSMSTPPASLGWMKLIRAFAVPLRGVSYSNRTPWSRSRSESASRSPTR
jgi:hypothetical protein